MTERKKDANLLEKDDDILELIPKKFRIKFRCEYFRNKISQKNRCGLFRKKMRIYVITSPHYHLWHNLVNFSFYFHLKKNRKLFTSLVLKKLSEVNK